jgi:hypothetical protein
MALLCFLIFSFGYTIAFYVVGAFLSDFFPLERTNYPRFPWQLPSFVTSLCRMYYPMLISSAFVQRETVFGRDKQGSQSGGIEYSDLFISFIDLGRFLLAMTVLTFLQAFEAPDIALYALLLIVFSLPWAPVRKAVKDLAIQLRQQR